ncbi:unnamed protein product, partial [Ascophyllum nodosum]
DAECHADGDADCDADGDAECDADGDADCDADGDAECHADGDAECHADGDAECHADGDADCHADGDADCHADADADCHADADAYCDADNYADDNGPHGGQCGLCGGVGCSAAPGGQNSCCTSAILTNGEFCSDAGEAPCVIGGDAPPSNSTCSNGFPGFQNGNVCCAVAKTRAARPPS